MGSEINYSIIIPHKNISDLLQRCLNSIPKREDIQIIVVDDNSDPDKVDFEHFPGVGEKCVEVYFTKEGKGAGYARNVGLKHAKGKWLLFADADDFYNDCFLSIIDKYKDSISDIIYFAVNSVYSDSLEPAERGDLNNKLLRKAVNSNDLNILRFHKVAPWAKMIKTCIVKKNQIYFEEVLVANDVRFSVYTGYYAKSISVDFSQIYCLTVRKGSLELTLNRQVADTRLEVACRVDNFLITKGLVKYRFNICSFLNVYRRLGLRSFLFLLRKIFLHYRGMYVCVFVDILKYLLTKMGNKKANYKSEILI